MATTDNVTAVRRQLLAGGDARVTGMRRQVVFSALPPASVTAIRRQLLNGSGDMRVTGIRRQLIFSQPPSIGVSGISSSFYGFWSKGTGGGTL